MKELVSCVSFGKYFCTDLHTELPLFRHVHGIDGSRVEAIVGIGELAFQVVSGRSIGIQQLKRPKCAISVVMASA